MSEREGYKAGLWRSFMRRGMFLLLFAVLLWGVALPVQAASWDGEAPLTSVVKYKKTWKILMVGNSFSVDSTEYLYDVAREAGCSVVVGNAYKGNRRLSDHWSYVENDEPAYTYRKNRYGKWKVKKKVTMEYALQDEKWDIIIFHPHSGESGQKKSYYPQEDVEGKSYVARLAEYARCLCWNPDVRIGWEMTWAYPQNTDISVFYEVYGGEQSKMYKAICKATKAVAGNEGSIDLIIPTGTAIQNARSSYLGDHFNRDGRHLSYGMGRYLAAMSVASACGIDLSDIQRLRIQTKEYSGCHLELLKKCVRDSEKKPYTVVKQKKKAPRLDKPEVSVFRKKKTRIIAWKSVPGATEYVVRRRRKGKKKYKTIATCSAQQTFFMDSHWLDRQYSYQICAKGDMIIRTVKSAWVKEKKKKSR